MTEDNLLNDINNGENDQLEFKLMPNQDSSKWLKTVVAFANCRGGRIIFGVANDHSIVGLSGDLFAIKDAITDAIADACTPLPNICVDFVNISNKIILVLDVYQGRQCPYYIRALGDSAGVYVRYDATTRLADIAALQELRLDGAGKGYDAIECRGLTINDEDIERLCQRLYKEAIENAPTAAQKALIKPVSKQQLLKWGILIEQGNHILPSNAYALLTGNDLLPTMIKCAIFRGTSRTFFVDRHPVSGSVIDLVKEAYKWILSKLNVAAKIVGTKRVDIFEIPPDAIRELIINAVIHRTYVDGASSPISLALYDDRLEITSPGGLPRGMTISKMLNGHSECRNKSLALAFEYMFFIENWGSGLMRVRNYLAAALLPEIQVSDCSTSLRITIQRPQNTQTAPKPENNQAEDNRLNGLHGQQRAICALMLDNPKISAAKIATQLNISSSTVEKHLAALRSKKIIHRQGGTRGYWVINQQNKS